MAAIDFKSIAYALVVLPIVFKYVSWQRQKPNSILFVIIFQTMGTIQTLFVHEYEREHMVKIQHFPSSCFVAFSRRMQIVCLAKFLIAISI